MCSIFGFSKAQDEEVISQFFKSMRHRGPDAENIISIDHWMLAHQRLSIIDTSSQASQPMSIDDSVIVFNGEIFNYMELKAKYFAYEQLNTNSDTEILLRGLNTFGISFLNELNGMFAFAWYKKSEKKLYLCRDRFGVKPLHWMNKNGIFSFSSEILPLINLSKNQKANTNIFKSFIKDTATDFNGETFISDIEQIPAGHYMEISLSGSATLTKWYEGNDYFIDPKIFFSEKSIIDAYEDLLVDAIRIRLRSDVPICLTLSGGIDSSVIYVLAKEKLSSPIKAFHFMHPNSSTDESKKVSKLVAAFGDFFCAIEAPDNIDLEEINKVLKVTEFPIWNPSALAYYQTYQTIANSGFKVVIEGHGSDEQLGGYSYMLQSAIKNFLYVGKFFQAYKIFKAANQTSNTSLGQKTSSFILPINFLRLILSIIRGRVLDFRKTLDHSFSYKILPIVLRAFDRLTMANSVESRCPFMDFRLVEFHRKLPISLMVSEMGNKTILRKILERRGLDFIYQDKEKMGFASDLPKIFSDPKVKQEILNAVSKVQFTGELESMRLKALKILNEPVISWMDISPIWKVYSIIWVQKFYRLDLSGLYE